MTLQRTLKPARWLTSAMMLIGLPTLGACELDGEFEAGIEDVGGEGDGDGDSNGDGDGDTFRAHEGFLSMTNPEYLCTGTISDGWGVMRYCRNRSIYSDNSNVKRSIILIHGAFGNAREQYYDPALAEAVLENVNMAETDIIALQFFQAENPGTTAQNTNYAEWAAANYFLWDGNWMYGANAKNHNRSSFSMVDHVIGQLMDHRPNLETIVVAGQSAGGQYVDRYSTTTNVATPGVDMRFWVANPHSYLWYDSSRPDPIGSCSSTYNKYSLGLSDIYSLESTFPYVDNKSPSATRLNAVVRNIYWTVGENDTGGTSSNCDYTCQGSNRNDRWFNHRQHIFDLCIGLGYGWACVTPYSRHIEIPGASHGFKDSVQSPEGHDILFN